MKISKTLILLLLSSGVLYSSCDSDGLVATEAEEIVPTTILFSGMEVYVDPDTSSSPQTRTTPSDAKVSRIAFKVYDTKGEEVYTEEKYVGTDVDFDHVTVPLHVGNYTFVAVAHKARTTESPVATINSPSSALLNELYVPNPVYSATQNVTIEGNTSQSITMNMGKRVNASFKLKVTDDFPDEVTMVEVITNPSKEAVEPPYAFDPATGFAPSSKSYAIRFIDYSIMRTKVLTSNLFLTSTEEQMDIRINMKDKKENILYTRTLENVTLYQHRAVIANGTFFSPNVTGGFTFDVENDPDINIPLDNH